MESLGYTVRFHWADYLVFVLIILLSCAIGVYYAVQDKRAKRNTVEDFLLAGRNMSVFPVSVSMFVSWLSAISFLGDPVEVYYQGSIYWIIGLGYCLGIPLAALVFAPKYHEMRVLSIFEFLETRYHRVVRTAATIIGGTGVAMYSGIVLYAPALALAQATGIQPWMSIIAIGTLCIIYTSMGGMKAVLWVDTVQLSIMFIGILILLIKGSMLMGGMRNVWSLAQESGRINFNRFNPSPFERSTFWAYLIGGFFRTFNPYTASQMEVQRYLTLRTKHQVKVALFMNIPLYALFSSMFALIGLLMVAYFKDCDPLLEGRIQKADQMVPLMMMEMLGYMPGMPGVFLACLFCASLSSMSSAQNSLATLALKDTVEPLYHRCTGHIMSTKLNMVVAKILSVAAGCLSIALAIVVIYLKDPSIFQICLKATGATGGPLAALFWLGLFAPFVTTAHVLIGSMISTAICMWLLIGPMVTDVRPSSTLPVTTDGCVYNDTLHTYNSTVLWSSIDTHNVTDNSHYPAYTKMFEMTPLLYNALGSMTTLLISLFCGLISTLFCGKSGKMAISKKMTKYEVTSPETTDYLEKIKLTNKH